jgi:hypothetical protein
MVPFRMFDRESKQMWQVINYHQGENGGHYLASREDDTEDDGNLNILAVADLVGFKFVEFVEESEAME